MFSLLCQHACVWSCHDVVSSFRGGCAKPLCRQIGLSSLELGMICARLWVMCCYRGSKFIVQANMAMLLFIFMALLILLAMVVVESMPSFAILATLCTMIL